MIALSVIILSGPPTIFSQSFLSLHKGNKYIDHINWMITLSVIILSGPPTIFYNLLWLCTNLIQCLPLYVIILLPRETDNNNRRITITSYFYTVIYSDHNKRLKTFTMITLSSFYCTAVAVNVITNNVIIQIILSLLGDFSTVDDLFVQF
jgi:hypothetical protein